MRQAENLEPDYDNYDFESAEGGNGSPPQESQGHSAEQIRATDFVTEFEYMGAGTRDDQDVSAQASASGCTGRERAVDPGWTGGDGLQMDGQVPSGRGNTPGCTGSDRWFVGGQATTRRGNTPGCTGSDRWYADGQAATGRGNTPGCTGNERLLANGQAATGRGMDPGWTGSERLFVGSQAVAGSGNVPGCTGDDVSGRGLYAEPGQMFRAGPNGYQRGSGGQIFDRQTGMWNGLGEQLDYTRSVQSEGREAQPVDPGRVEMFEALVAQLLRRDAASSADEGCHERVDFVHSSSAVTAGRGSFKEGRGSHRTGEPKHRLGKGIGEQYGIRVNTNLRVFQPPWTSFQPEPDAVMSAMLTSGPGNDLLAATRAM